MLAFIKNLKFPAWSRWFILLGLCLFSYGIFALRMGYYWDDWETALVLKMYPLSEFWKYFESNRPLAAWTYMIFAPLAGTQPAAWQFTSLLLRWLATLAMAWSMGLVWPNAKRLLFYASLLFAVYPLFLQQSISMSYHQHWVGYALFFLSLGLMVLGFNSNSMLKRLLLNLVAVAAMLLHLAIFEYFVGVELLRPVLLWFTPQSRSQPWKKRLVNVLLTWLPYLLILIVFSIWRLNLAVAQPESANQPVILMNLFTQPLSIITKMAEFIMQDLVIIVLTSWQKTISTNLFSFKQIMNPYWWAGGAALILTLALYLPKLKIGGQTQEENHQVALEIILVASLAVLLGPLPIWLTGKQVTGGLFSDRFGLAALFGASLLWAAAICWFDRGEKQKIIIIVLLVSLAAGLQLRTQYSFRQSWKSQNQVYWQLFWRAPSITPQTAIIADSDITTYVRPTFAFNALYLQPAQQSHEMAYMFFASPAEAETHKKDNRYQMNYREFTASIDPGNILVVYRSPKGQNCLWVLDPSDAGDPAIPAGLRNKVTQSNLTRIQLKPNSPDYPPRDLFNEEPVHSWCYFYEKASLAAQYGQWKKAADLINQAEDSGTLKDAQPHELIPAIQAKLETSQWDFAKELSLKALDKDERYKSLYCQLWDRYSKVSRTGADELKIYRDFKKQAGCR
jgi:hypothetical protein